MSLDLRMAAVVLVVALAAGCMEERPPPGGASLPDPEAEALDFSLQVVETYFTQDYAAFRTMLAPAIYTLEGEGPMTPEDVDAWHAREPPWPAGRDYSGHSMEEYLEVYAPRVLTIEAAQAEHPEFAQMSWDGWEPDEDDYVFIGWETKPDQEPFLWDDLLAFAVTHESGEWRFKAFSG